MAQPKSQSRSAADLVHRFQQVRQQSEALAATLSDADATAQSMENVTTNTLWLRDGVVLKSPKGYGDFDRWAEEIEEAEIRQLEKIKTQLKAEEHWLQRGVTGRRARNMGRLHKLKAMNGRICISGQVADYNLTPEETPGIVNTKPFITHRVLMQGLVVFDFAREFPVALNEMATLIGKGELKLKEERFEGLDKMPEAFCGLFRGENFGRRVVQVENEL